MAKKKEEQTFAETIQEEVESLNSLYIAEPKNAKERLLNDLFVYQETASTARKLLDETYEKCREAGLLESDEDLRKYEAGEYVEFKSKQLALTVMIKEPGIAFDRSKFIIKAAKKFGVDPSVIDKMMEKCTKENAAAVVKKVVER